MKCCESSRSRGQSQGQRDITCAKNRKIINNSDGVRGIAKFVKSITLDSCCFCVFAVLWYIYHSAECLALDGTNSVDNCLVSVDTTRCSSVHSMSFYFDSETGQCAELPFGCSSSDNAFATLETCRQQCAAHLAISVTDSAARGLQY